MKKPEYRNEVGAAVHEGVRGMHRLGLVDKKTMREFDVRCLTVAEDLSAADIQELVELPDETPDQGRVAEARSDLRAVERALEGLPARRRAMFRRFWVHNIVYKEIALEFNVSERTVRHELLLATRYLQEATEEIFVADLQKRLSEVSSQ